MAATPKHTQVLVIGGGPAGAYASTILARDGLETTVLEATKFPRYHIGESMLPSLTSFLSFIDLEDKFRAHGFMIKRGAAVKFNQRKGEGYTDFIKDRPDNASWNVIRSEFDDMLLKHAAASGVTVCEEHKVTEIKFEGEGEDRHPVSALYTKAGGEKGEITFDYLVDASGRLGLMSTKYLKNRKQNKSLQNLACWGYWKGDYKQYMPGTRRENAPYFEALTDESGWGWFIPLHNGTVSVGVVMDQDVSAAKKANGRKMSPTGEHTLKDHYLGELELLPNLKALLGTATIVDEAIKSASDYSYSADSYAGNRFRIIGDASAFIDPLFSSGVHLALLGGLSAATSIAASIRGDCTEAAAATYHTHKVGSGYTRFFLVVMSAYKQIKDQQKDILADVDEANFDRAFDIIRPVIQGTNDIGKKLTEDELDRTIDFVKDVFEVTTPEKQAEVVAMVGHELLSPSAPLLSVDQMKKLVPEGDADAFDAIRKANARKIVAPLFSGTSVLETEAVDGYVARLVRGQLGLVKAA